MAQLATIPSGRRWWEALILTMVVTAAGLLANPGLLVRVAPISAPPSHPAISLDQALNADICGKPGLLSPEFDVARALSQPQAPLRDPLGGVAASLAGSRDRYCSSVVQPYLNNENSLMWLMRALLRVNGDVSAVGLAHGLTWLRIAMLDAFVFALLVSGCGLGSCFAFTVFALAILNHLTVYDYSAYPFLLVLPLVSAGLYILVRRSTRLRHILYRPIVAALAGVLAGLTANMRTTHLILCAAMFAMFLFSVRTQTPAGAATGWRRVVAMAIVPAAAFVFGYMAFDRVAIAPLLPSPRGDSFNYSYHAVMHPIVLALASPENDLSRREGIHWDDRVGVTLARRVRPDATFLGPLYEPALRSYYFGLWRRYPWEMLRLYTAKFTLAGNGMFDTLSRILARMNVRFYRVARLDDVVDGWMLLAVNVGEGVWAWRRYARTGSSLYLGFALVSLCASLLFVECAMITSVFYPAYYSLLLFNCLVAATIPFQAAADRLIHREGVV